ncbi:hypothetical protein ACH4TX_02845 [Streptomyces sp. NPDC021098]|uniref:hypothetical protein n=1 Tax=unclassified Streptomyces TaxID=2593676 RepID=UPI0037B1CB60
MVYDPDAPRVLADELIAALDPLPYPRRMRELAGWVRAASAQGRLAVVIGELAGRGAYERRLAAAAAAIGGRTGHLEARLADPDPLVRGHALRVRVGDEALEAAFEDAPASVRRQLVRTVVAQHRTALADRLVDPLRERWGDAEAARLLPGCGADTAVRLLPALFHAIGSWRPLTARHPAAVLDEAERQLTALPVALRAGWWTRYAPGVALAARAEPHRVLDLLERRCHSPLPPPLRHRLGTLVAADPGRTLDLLLTPEHIHLVRGRGLERAVLRRLVAADPPELDALGRALAHYDEAMARLLTALPPARRAAFFDAATAERDRAHAVLAPAVLDALPRAARHAEARRMAEQARERGAHWATVLEAVAYLPVEEAHDELLAATRRPAADDRATAYPLLIRNAARSGDPDAVTALLRQLEGLRNEPDPVRHAALDALAALSPALFTDDAAEPLDRVATDAIQARDSSTATRRALRRLAVALLREHAVTGRRELLGWGLRTVTRLAGSVGAADLGRLDHQLRRGQEHTVVEALRPWLEAGAERVDHELTFALVRSLGRRAHTLPELQELLGQAIAFGRGETARTAIALWLEPPRERDARVAELLAQEPSAAVLPPVLAVLTRRRTDLLDLVLGDTPPYGRFLTHGTHWTPPTGRDSVRWLPRQQVAAARLLAKAAADTALPTDERASAVARAAPLDEGGAPVVRTWAAADDVALAEAALAALPRTRRPGDALPLLLAHAGGDRARVAVYAAAAAARHVPPSRLDRLIRGVLAPDGVATAVPSVPAKVTSRKEAVRLAATHLPVPDAATLLADAQGLPGQHPDVQAVCVRFAARLLGTKRAWELLTAAAGGRRELRHAVLRARPLDLPELHRERYAQLIRVVCDTEDPEVAASGHAALARWSPWAPDAAALLVAAVTDLGNRANWRSAADALLALMATAPDGAAEDNPLAWALAALVTADARTGMPDAEPDRDRPARQRVRHLADRLAQHGRMRPREMRRHALGAAELLAGYETFVPEAAQVLVQALDLDARPTALTAALARLARLHTSRPVLAARTADLLRNRLDAASRPGGGEALLRAAWQLEEDGGHAAGLFAAVLTGIGGPRTAWAEPWRERVRGLRQHPHPDVRDAALRLTTAGE